MRVSPRLGFCARWLFFLLRNRTLILRHPLPPVLGMCKEVLTILVASTLYGDHLDVVNASGMALVLVGVGLYKLHRAKTDVASQPYDTVEMVPLIADEDLNSPY